MRWGADEIASKDDGQTPVEQLDLIEDGVDYRATQDDVDRTRLLLARAPTDRAWRRRGWVVIVRSRGPGTTTTSSDGVGESVGASSSSDCIRQDDGRSAARTQTWGEAESASDKVGTGSGTDGDGERRSGVVELLLGLEVEGVFRTVVGFREEG